MDFGPVDEANDLLSNGILVQTPKGLVCMSLNDALTSDLNLSVEDFQNVATQLILQQSKKGSSKEKPLISVQSVQAINSSFVSSDTPGDSDGFTSESSDINTLLTIQPTSSYTLLEPSVKFRPVKVEHRIVEFSTDVESLLSSNVSDSDTNSIIIPPAKVDDKVVNIEVSKDIMESTKTPTKKRGGWPKGRKRKPELLHLPPKAPSTGYNLYLNEQRKLYKESPLPFHEITKLIGNTWSSLSLDDKRPYLVKAEEEKRRYKEELREYRQSGAYQLYLANKRRKRAKYNVLSESDMDATDDLDEEDNEELYCRTCDQYFHNLHNKREHLQGRQHMQSVAGAIHSEIGTDYDTDNVSTSNCQYFSTSIDESSLDAVPSGKSDLKGQSGGLDTVSEYMNQLVSAITKRETEIKSLTKSVKEKNTHNTALHRQLAQLKEREGRLKRDLSQLKDKEKKMDQNVFNLWQVPSWFVITDLTQISDCAADVSISNTPGTKTKLMKSKWPHRVHQTPTFNANSSQAGHKQLFLLNAPIVTIRKV